MAEQNGEPVPDAGLGAELTGAGLRQHVADLGMQRRLMTRYPKRFAKLDKAALDKITKAWITAVDDAEQVEDPARRGALKDSVMRTAVMAEKVHQADEHQAENINAGTGANTTNVLVFNITQAERPAIAGPEAPPQAT